MSKHKQALGKGLGALLPVDQPGEEGGGDISRTRLYNFEERIRAAGRVSEIEIDLIDPNPFQPRSTFDETSLDELAASIRQFGIIQPVTVRTVKLGRYELISGERRLRAARRAKLTRIPAFVREADSESMLEMALVENVQRESLNPVEIALGYQRLIDECGLKQEQVATKVSKNRTTIANFLRLLRLPARVQTALRDGSISTGHARALLSLESEGEQNRILSRIVKDGLSVRAVEDLVRAIGEDQPQKSPPSATKKVTLVLPEDLEMRAIRDRLRSTFSTQVAIKPAGKGKGGRIELEYYSDEDLERLVEIMLG